MPTRSLFSILGLFLLMIGISIPSSAQHPAGLITTLQAKGWKMVYKSEEIRELPGQPPYENLTREVQIVVYTFEKKES